MIKLEKEISASQEVIFDLTQNYTQRQDWDPFTESYRFLNDKGVEKGLLLEIKAKNGQSMVVEYVSFNRPSVVAIKMIKGPWFIKNFAGSWQFQRIDKNKSKVIFKYNIVFKPGWIKLVMSYYFRRSANNRLIALKHYIENKL